ncbi:glycosyltransferase family 4 protein [uncultured Methylophaga sp.]|uniref:glycosyltransferase family 4 protein n=1 Tax=uncultured Methylophaga sp. TaxID=285271 RepID=UPI00262FAF00|nr:glycosyltransferase family 4 protein [uncultured Methylophaga sp.]
MGGRHRHLSRELSNIGHKVTLISARWTHGTRDEIAADNAPETEEFEGFQFHRINVHKYKHAHDKKRVLNWFEFAWRIRKLPKKLDEKPDIIIYSSPSLIGYLGAHYLAKKNRAKLIFEVRDIWPLTLTLLGGFSQKHPFIRFMQWIEDFAYSKSSNVISNLEGAVEHAKSRGMLAEKFNWIPNGFSEFELNTIKPASKEILESLRHQEFSLTYTGAIGEANSLDTLIDAAELLKDSAGVHFNIVGRGRLQEKLEQEARDRNLKNVHFWGAVAKNQVQSVLRNSDLCLICWRDSKLYNHGIAANKLFDYLYAGKPVLNAYSGGYDLISRYQCGLTVTAESPQALAEGILQFKEMSPKLREKIGQNGREAVIKNHEYQNIALKLNSIILNTRSQA